MAKLNRKKKPQDVKDNLTLETKARFLVNPSDGKIILIERPPTRLSIRDMR